MFGTLQLIEQLVGRLSVCEENLEPSQLAPLVEPLKQLFSFTISVPLGFALYSNAYSCLK